MQRTPQRSNKNNILTQGPVYQKWLAPSSFLKNTLTIVKSHFIGRISYQPFN